MSHLIVPYKRRWGDGLSKFIITDTRMGIGLVLFVEHGSLQV